MFKRSMSGLFMCLGLVALLMSACAAPAAPAPGAGDAAPAAEEAEGEEGVTEFVFAHAGPIRTMDAPVSSFKKIIRGESNKNAWTTMPIFCRRIRRSSISVLRIRLASDVPSGMIVVRARSSSVKRSKVPVGSGRT